MFGILKKNFCEIENNVLKSQLTQKAYGFKENNILKLDLFETKYLFDKKKIKLKENNKIVTKKRLEEICNKINKFSEKYIVFKDFRDKGKIIKDGSKFGFDFRVYENKNYKIHEHTKYVVDVRRTHKDSFSNIIKSERLANNIKAKYILAIVDQENKITKIKIERII